MKNIIFYFSGTGNSYFVAESIAGKMGNTEIAPLLKAIGFDITKYHTIGFVFPVYYTHAPKIVLKEISTIHLNYGQKVFAVATRGGSWGYALEDVRNILPDDVLLQEYQIKMPGNYILEYGAMPFLQKRIFKESEKQINTIVKSILAAKCKIQVEPNAIAKLAKNMVSEKIEAFPNLGAKFFATEKCTHCMQCVQICPVNNITVKDRKLVWGNKCSQCMACIQWCPQNAVSHPLLKNGRIRYTHPNVTVTQIEASNLGVSI